jgi:hypothetical protein
MGKFLTQNEFLFKARKIHGEKYNYEKSIYVRASLKIIITCPIHGDFTQTPSCHLAGCGCKKCATAKVSSMAIIPQKEFICRCVMLHGDKYDYSEVKYNRASDKINIICKKHGMFSQLAASHVAGRGCPQCAIELYAYSKNDFLIDAKATHGDKYEYDLIGFTTKHKKIKIFCKEHGWFLQTPHKHITRKQGCPICGYKRGGQLNIKDWSFYLRQAMSIHNNYYDYSKVNYLNYNSKIEIICPKHGSFWQAVNSHLAGRGCPQCKNEKVKKAKTKTTEEFIINAKKIHGETYDYSLVEYINSKKPIKILCKKHGVFEQTPNVHLHGVGCPICRESRLEYAARTALCMLGVKYERQKTFPNLKRKLKLRFDFYLPEYNAAIECNGEQHYKEHKLYEFAHELCFNSDMIKYQYCLDNNINLIIIADIKHVDQKYQDLYEEFGFLPILIYKYTNTPHAILQIKECLKMLINDFRQGNL